MASDNAVKAFAAIATLSRASKEAVSFLRGKVGETRAKVTETNIDRLIAER